MSSAVSVCVLAFIREMFFQLTTCADLWVIYPLRSSHTSISHLYEVGKCQSCQATGDREVRTVLSVVPQLFFSWCSTLTAAQQLHTHSLFTVERAAFWWKLTLPLERAPWCNCFICCLFCLCVHYACVKLNTRCLISSSALWTSSWWKLSENSVDQSCVQKPPWSHLIVDPSAISSLSFQHCASAVDVAHTHFHTVQSAKCRNLAAKHWLLFSTVSCKALIHLFTLTHTHTHTPREIHYHLPSVSRWLRQTEKNC